MIDLMFSHASEIVIVRIDGTRVTFGSTTFGAKMADISGLHLDFNGTIRQFPDLRTYLEWRQKAIERFKTHILALGEEEKIAEYVIYELRNKGYTPKLKQKRGFRPVRIN